MLAIAALHVGAVAVLMSAKMDLPARLMSDPVIVEFIPAPIPPAPAELPKSTEPVPRPRPAPAPLDPVVPLPENPSVEADPLHLPQPLPALPGTGDIASGVGSSGATDSPAVAATLAVLLTGPAELKPPYPAAKLASGEEADLKLRLTVDARGRVVSVEPMGRADREFLSAARRHIMAHWRYRPATRGGQGIATQLVITLRFRLDE